MRGRKSIEEDGRRADFLNLEVLLDVRKILLDIKELLSIIAKEKKKNKQ